MLFLFADEVPLVVIAGLSVGMLFRFACKRARLFIAAIAVRVLRDLADQGLDMLDAVITVRMLFKAADIAFFHARLIVHMLRFFAGQAALEAFLCVHVLDRVAEDLCLPGDGRPREPPNRDGQYDAAQRRRHSVGAAVCQDLPQQRALHPRGFFRMLLGSVVHVRHSSSIYIPHAGSLPVSVCQRLLLSESVDLTIFGCSSEVLCMYYPTFVSL